MRSIKVDELEPGQIFDKPVYVDGVNLLVPENVPIREKDLERLRKWNISEVVTEGHPLNKAPGAGRQSFLQQAFNKPAQQEVMKKYSALADRLRQLHEAVRQEHVIDSDEIDGIIDELRRLLAERKNDVIEYILYGFQGEAGAVENALNATILCILVGEQLGMQHHKLLHLATAALLHDIGMLRLPESITNKKGELSPEESKQVRTHPIHSYKIVTRELKYVEEIGLAALQHQERWDGQGYPRGLSGKNITLLARIIAIVDTFEAMVSKRPYRSPMIGYTAMRSILSDNARRFDPEILKVFIRTFGIYPIGSIVLLSDSSIGRVIENNANAPLKPKVKIMIDQFGREYGHDDGNIIDLGKDKKLYIAKAVDPNELKNR